jgi:hypothetical protein
MEEPAGGVLFGEVKMSVRMGLFGFGRSIKTTFFDSKETRLEKVVRHSYKLKNHWAPEFLEVELEEVEPLLTEREQEGSDDAEPNP